MKKLCIIFISVLILSVSFIAAEDSSDWKTVSISGNDFKIPPKYSNGELSDYKYQIDNWNNFAILCVDTFLESNYGYVASLGNGEKMTINGHPAIYFCSYNSYEKTDLSRVYFASGNSIYCISYQGSNLTSDIREIVSTSNPSSISGDEFYSRLDKAVEEHEIKERIDQNTHYPTYYSYDDSSSYNDDSAIKDFFFYKMGQYSTRY